MIAKLIVHGRDREEALLRMQRALQECVVEGVHSTVPFHLEVLAHLDFRAGRYDTGFLDRYQAAKDVSESP
jgi:acetyl-CoA carboxylase biotin carboxylase subunit